MTNNATFVIETADGWGYYNKREHPLPIPTPDILYFEVDDDIEPFGHTTCMDGMRFTVWIEYQNNTGSRKEKVCLKPEKISD